MDHPSSSSSSSAVASSSPPSAKQAYLVVVVPMIILSGIVFLLNPKTHTSIYSLPASRISMGSHAGPEFSAPARPAATENQRRDTENEKSSQDSKFRKNDSLQDTENEKSSKDSKFRKPFSSFDLVEASLARARATIRETEQNNKTSYEHEYVPAGPIYRNPKAFHRSYLEMEKLLKIYVYKDGEPPLFHYSTSLGILGIEGILMHQIEISKFRTSNPEKAHVYFIPLSTQSIAHYAYQRHNRAWYPLQNIAKDYIDLISAKYPYWNRTLGRDHVFLGCHDWTPTVSKGVELLYKNSIRVLCNANTSEGFKPSIDVSLPEIYLPHGNTEGLLGGPSPSKRSILVFYAGGVHGDIRKALMDHWRDKDPDVQVHEYLPKGESYYEKFRKSKYCICPSGYEVASPRMVEAIYMGCVPVLLKDHYAKPFDDVLDWSRFSVDVKVSEIPDLKKILTGIPKKKYLKMQRLGLSVRRHFEVNFPPKRFDVFHMTLHSVWVRRLNIQLRDITH